MHALYLHGRSKLQASPELIAIQPDDPGFAPMMMKASASPSRNQPKILTRVYEPRFMRGSRSVKGPETSDQSAATLRHLTPAWGMETHATDPSQ